MPMQNVLSGVTRWQPESALSFRFRHALGCSRRCAPRISHALFIAAFIIVVPFSVSFWEAGGVAAAFLARSAGHRWSRAASFYRRRRGGCAVDGLAQPVVGGRGRNWPVDGGVAWSQRGACFRDGFQFAGTTLARAWWQYAVGAGGCWLRGGPRAGYRIGGQEGTAISRLWILRRGWLG